VGVVVVSPPLLLPLIIFERDLTVARSWILGLLPSGVFCSRTERTGLDRMGRWMEDPKG
jgi:hypothetical protein